MSRLVADPREMTPSMIAILAGGFTPHLRRTHADDAPTPIYDALVRERDTGRDARGRWVKAS